LGGPYPGKNDEETMRIDLSRLNFSFTTPPLLIGGMAMEYYGLRPTGADIDFVITQADYERLAAQYPQHLKDLFGDLGVCVFEFEIWRSICLFGYDFLAEGALDVAEYRVISLEKLLFLKTLAMHIEKYHHDMQLIVKRIRDLQYADYVPHQPDSETRQPSGEPQR
jgi:hypothetical protein